MKVHIVVKLDGWILEKQAREIEKRLNYVTVGDQHSRNADINYYMSYALFTDKTKFDMCYFTAYQPNHPTLALLWEKAAKNCDLAVASANRYIKKLKEFGVKRIEMIVPGFDKKLFYPILRVGIVGKTDEITDRKNASFVKKLMETVPKNVKFVFAGEGWPAKCKMYPYEKMPDFYRAVDVIFIPSKVESSPMPVVEALACGIPVIAPDIGYLDMFPHTEYKVDDIKSALKAIDKHLKIKMKRYNYVKEYTWDNWAEKHRKLFEEIVRKGGDKK